MTNKIWRLIFIILLALITGLLGWYGAVALTRTTWDLYSTFFKDNRLAQVVYQTIVPAACGVFGFAMGRAIFRRIEQTGERFVNMTPRDRLAIIGGLVIGLILTAILSIPLFLAISDKLGAIAGVLLMGVVVMYLSTVATLSLKDEIHLYMPPPTVEDNPIPTEKFKILDTNVIIDGRIADVARAGFLEGPLYIPGFVLDELQHIADSSDGLKRARGRRGLDILNGMQKELTLVVRSYDKLVPGHDEVDSRLVRLAKAVNGVLVTNDFNLNKVAELQGVQVLNVNELANALKPVVLPGEEMRVAVVKEGKEASQGVGYLDDGTMIVIEGGRRFLGETVSVNVASVLQTQAGKMIFAHVHDDTEGDGEGSDQYARNVRDYTSRRPRRPVR